MRSVLFAALLSVAFAVDPFVRYIHELQLPSGGFHEVGVEQADLQTSANALFLVSLYGLRAQINADDAATYVQNLESPVDHGYAESAGQPSDIESTRAALLSYVHLGKAVPNADEVGNFVRSLFNVNTGMFAGRAGETGDLRSTALAIEALHILGELKKPIFQESLKRINQLLSERVVGSTSLHFSFEDASATPVTDNYHGLLLAKHSGFAFKDTSKWVDWITALQDIDPNSPTFGGFFSNLKKTAVTPEATAHAALSLHLLGAKIGNEDFLSRFALSRKPSLQETVFSHLAFAHTSKFRDFLDIRVVFDGNSDDDQVTQGVDLVPAVVISTFDRKVPHGGFSVTASANGGWSSELAFDSARFGYISGKEFETDDLLGPVSFTFSLKANVYPIGDISFTKTQSKLIGYQLALTSAASFEGRAIETGDSVLSGTEFAFGVSLSTSEKSTFFSGDFKLNLSVLDASGVAHHTASVDGETNNKAISFQYVLTGEDFPSGAVTFSFEVSNSNGVHTRKTAVYKVEQQMVASDIKITGGKSLGSDLTVTMQPGTLKDLHTTVPFSATNAAKRSFVMDIVSSQGTVLQSVDGKASGSSYTFTTSIPASLDFIGSSVIAFRFVSSDATSVKLHPFDSATNELFENPSSLVLNVDAKIHLSDVEQKPKDGTTDVKFGYSVPFKFQLKDDVSGKKLVSGSKSAVTISLVSGGFVSASVTAVANENGFFEASLDVDANAVKGAGEVVIKAAGVDGTSVTVFRDDKKEEARFKVNVGGEIELTSSTYSTSSGDAGKTAFVLTFGLSCESKPLKNARLVATVTHKTSSGSTVVNHYGQPLSNLDVAVDGTARYSFSFSLPHNEFASGDYHVQFRREVDVARQGADAASLFEISHYHKRVEAGGLWLQMELISVVVLVGVYVAVSSHSKLFSRKKDL